MTGKKLVSLDVAKMVSSPPPPVEWIAQSLVVRGGVTMLSGSPGVGKSMLALMLGVSIANGDTFLDDYTASGRVLYVDAENGRSEAHRRIHGLGLRSDAVSRLRYLAVNEHSRGGDQFDLARDADELISEAIEFNADYVVLDSLRSLWGGMENESHTAILPMLSASRLARAANAGVLLLHHLDKGAAHAYRGSSAFAGAAEIVAALRPDPRSRREETEADADSSLRCITVSKCRCAPEPGNRWLRFTSEAGITVIEAVDKPPVPERAAPVRDRLVASVLATLPVDPDRMSIGTLASRLGISAADSTLKRVLRKLSEDGSVIRSSHGYATVIAAGHGSPALIASDPLTLDVSAMGRHGEGGNR
jgi:hypothetical protein